jgi:hypothetical protein
VGWVQGAVVATFIGGVGLVAAWVVANDPRAAAPRAAVASVSSAPLDPAEAERCKVPDFAKALGHEEKWKLHNNCK